MLDSWGDLSLCLPRGNGKMTGALSLPIIIMEPDEDSLAGASISLNKEFINK
jgi:hypothetical protein